jgi:hypothetical protein
MSPVYQSKSQQKEGMQSQYSHSVCQTARLALRLLQPAAAPSQACQ